MAARHVVATVFAAPARAAPSRTDRVEHAFGTTPIHAVTGHGRLSVGISKEGDLSTLVWPNPSYCDQVAYLTSNALDARALPYFGTPPASGVMLGLLVQAAGQGAKVVWLNDSVLFSVDQDYGPSDGANVHTRFVSQVAGVAVEVVDAVVPGSSGGAHGDALVRQETVTRTHADAAQVAELRTYANLSPQSPNSRLPELRQHRVCAVVVVRARLVDRQAGRRAQGPVGDDRQCRRSAGGLEGPQDRAARARSGRRQRRRDLRCPRRPMTVGARPRRHPRHPGPAWDGRWPQSRWRF
ncbi:MAG: hypothetical protein FJ100_14700 [Deltaproteobacteria bacterium]|nr:hypothetical protein [Deltaproteobacteria bacterium]